MSNQQQFRAAIKRHYTDVCALSKRMKKLQDTIANSEETSLILADNWCIAHDYASSRWHDFFTEVEREAMEIDDVRALVDAIIHAPITDDGAVTVYSPEDNIFVLSNLRVFGTLNFVSNTDGGYCSFDDAIDHAVASAAKPAACVKMPCQVLQAMLDALLRDLQHFVTVV